MDLPKAIEFLLLSELARDELKVHARSTKFHINIGPTFHHEQSMLSMKRLDTQQKNNIVSRELPVVWESPTRFEGQTGKRRVLSSLWA